MIDDPKLVYLHIPKCGGTSLVVALRQAYSGVDFQSFDYTPTYHAVRCSRSEWDSARWLETWFRFRAICLSQFLLQKKGFVYGHMPLSSSALRIGKEGGYRFFTVLRDPVERFISNYVYDKTGPGQRIPDLLSADESTHEAELALFLDTPESLWMANEQLVMIAGLSETGSDFGESSMLERGIQQASSLELIGWTELMDDFAAGFEHKFGVHLSVDRHNKTETWIKHEQSDPATYKALFTEDVRTKIKKLAASEYEWLDAIR